MNAPVEDQTPRERRSNVLLAASIEAFGRAIDVRLRNLSADGALIEGDGLPVEGSEIRFRRQELVVRGTIVWVKGKRAGIRFAGTLSTESLLRHVPAPRPRPQLDFRRPGLTSRPLSERDSRLGAAWANSSGAGALGE